MTFFLSNAQYRPAVFIFLLLTASCSSLFSQAFTKYNYAGAQGASLNFKLEPSDQEIDGSPYYADEWKPGAIYNRDNTYTELDQLKYNVYIDELVFVFNGAQYIVPEKEQIKRVKLGDEEFVGAFNGEKYSFYKILEPGESMLILRNFQSTIAKGTPSKGYIPATKDHYQLNESVYLLKPGQNAHKINPKKGLNFLNHVHDKRSEMEEYIKTERLKMKNMEDLTAAVRYYNSISNPSPRATDYNN